MSYPWWHLWFHLVHSVLAHAVTMKTPWTISYGDFEPSDVQSRNHNFCPLTPSCDKLYNTARLLDLAFRIGADVASFDDQRYLRDAAFAEQLRVAGIKEVDDRSLIGGLGVKVLLPLVFGNERPELVEVDCRLPAGRGFSNMESGHSGCEKGNLQLILGTVEVAHADLAEIARVILVQVGAMMMLEKSERRKGGSAGCSMAYLTSSETPTTRMFSMLPNASVACRNVATVLSCLSQACRHFLVVVVWLLHQVGDVDGMFKWFIKARDVCGFFH